MERSVLLAIGACNVAGYGRSVDDFQRVHDLRVVRPSAAHPFGPLAGRFSELVRCIGRVLFSSARQPVGTQRGNQHGATEDGARSHHALRVLRVFGSLSQGTVAVELLGRLRSRRVRRVVCLRAVGASAEMISRREQRTER
jgi:hypothetical protein